MVQSKLASIFFYWEKFQIKSTNWDSLLDKYLREVLLNRIK